MYRRNHTDDLQTRCLRLSREPGVKRPVRTIVYPLISAVCVDNYIPNDFSTAQAADIQIIQGRLGVKRSHVEVTRKMILSGDKHLIIAVMQDYRDIYIAHTFPRRFAGLN